MTTHSHCTATQRLASLMGLVIAILLGWPGVVSAQFVDATSGPLGDTGGGEGVAWGDYDNDGDLDLFLSNAGLNNRLFRNDGNGTFADATSGPLVNDVWVQSAGVAWGDYDNDGDLDLFVAKYYSHKSKLFRNEGSGTFVDATSGPLADTGEGWGVAWGDYDNDGNLDLYLANAGPSKLFRNDGNGTFADATSGPLGDTGDGAGVAWGDYDNDGDLDLYLFNAGPNKLFRNDGGGVFVDATSGPLGDAGLGAAVAWADYDNDGDLDLFLANFDRANKLLRNDGGGTFVDATSGPLGDTGVSAGVAWGDYDNDGDLDLYLANNYQEAANKLFRNDGNGAFVDATSFPLGDTGDGNGVAWGDYDNDGDLDLYLANYGQANKLFRNETAAAGRHWLQVKLEGTVSNRTGIGARVKAVAGDVSQIRELSGGSGYCSQDALVASFGLGSATSIDRLEVRWPSGIVQVVEPVPAVDQAITVVERLPDFVDATSGPLGGTGSGNGVAWGDYDNDSDLDLYLSYGGQANKLLRNDGGGTFGDATGGPMGDTGNGTGVAWGDCDNDNDLDLYLSNIGSTNKLFRNDGGGAFENATSGPLGGAGVGYGVAWGDYNNDGDLDLYLANWGLASKLFHNNGDGTFVDATSGPLGSIGNGTGVAWGDYDNDGDLDLYLTNAGQANKLFRNDGNGTFVDATSGPLGDTGNGYGVAWGDYDNDCDLDLYLANNGPNKLFRNNGGGVFVDATSGPLGDTGNGKGVTWGDYDNDGDLDLYLANGGEANKLFRNDGGGVFADATSYPMGDAGFGQGVAWGDYDNDGDLDLYLANSGSANKLFRNEGAAAGRHWLQVKLEGTVSNRAGIGARVKVMAGPLSQIREISGGSGCFSQDALVASFGLGSTTSIDLLEVRWPSGIVQMVDPVPAVDQTITVVERLPDFVDATSGPLGDTGHGIGVAWGDYDNDGDLDLYLANASSANKLFRNDGGGVFVDATSGPLGDDGSGMGVAWGDYDNDGDLDLYLSNWISPNSLLRNDGSGAFVDVTSGPLGDTGQGQGVAWGDYDNDGDLDLYLANLDSPNKLLRNDGNGTFVDATSGPLGDTGHGIGVAWGDYDNDGDLDLYLANLSSANKLFRNDGGGVFVDATSGPLGDNGSGRGVAWGDYDNDGDLDLYLANNGPNKLFRNDGGGTFVDATSGPLGDAGNGAGVAWGDYDNDGDLDLYLSNAGSANKLFRNDGGGTFVEATSGPLGDTGIGQGVAWGDYDSDGDLDLYLANYGPNKLFRNETAAAGRRWLQVKLEGTVSNRAGIGARVKVVAGGVSQIREVSGGSGFLSQDALVASFGLGSTTSIDLLEVRWPSGIVQVVEPVPAVDQAITVVELSGSCCAVDGTCTLTLEANCLAPSVWHGDWHTCDPNPCPQPGACCPPAGPCTMTLETGCAAPSVWQGASVSCDPDPCQTCVSVVAGTPSLVGDAYVVPLSTPDPLLADPIYAFTIDVYIDPAFLTLTAASGEGTMTEGDGLFLWRELSPGLIRVTWAGVNALVGPGDFAYLILEKPAAAPCGECTPLDVRDILLNEGEPCALAVDGEFCVPTFGLGGRVTYYACDSLDFPPPNPRALSGVHLQAVRDCGGEVDSLEALTDATGNYLLEGCPDCQACLTPWHERSADSTAITSWDTSLILNYVLLLDPLDLCIEDAAVYDPTGLGDESVCAPPDGFQAGLEAGAGYPGDPADFRILPQKVVADVSRNHSVTAYDGSLILKYLVGDPLGMASQAGEWDFYGAQRCYAPGVAITTADFVGLLNGDVSGSWEPEGFRSGPTGPPILVTETLQPLPESLWLATISVTGADGYRSGDYRLSVPQSDWELVQVRPAPPASNSVVEGRLAHDVLRVAMAGAEPVGDGEVVRITLRSLSEELGAVPELLWAEINDGSRPVELHQPSAVPGPSAEMPAGKEFTVDPNPSRQQVRLTFRVAEAGPCLLEVFAPDGRVVRRVTEGPRAAGVHTMLWDGRGEQGTALPSGVYFARLRLGEVQVEQRLVILR